MKDNQRHSLRQQQKITSLETKIKPTKTNLIQLKATNILAKPMGIKEQIRKMLRTQTCFSFRNPGNTLAHRFPNINPATTTKIYPIHFLPPEAAKSKTHTSNNQTTLILKCNFNKELKLQEEIHPALDLISLKTHPS